MQLLRNLRKKDRQASLNKESIFLEKVASVEKGLPRAYLFKVFKVVVVVNIK